MSQASAHGLGSPHADRLLDAIRWRCIGPPRGGRVVTVAGDPHDMAVFYFGACAGGVWKTADAGITWRNISDGFFRTASVGAIAVAESDPNVIYAGMGEATIRLDVSHGDGVYRSTDGGQTWTHLGLEDTRHIGKIRVHPTNPDVVYVAALGHAFGPNESRGVFRSVDGGQTWECILYKSENAGAIDLVLDPRNPRILYASIWEARRSFWNFSSGGPDSGIYKSIDGGDTWTELTGNPGLPEGIKGKIGIAASPAQAGRVWAVVEAHKGGFFRSDDGGATWELQTAKADLRYRPWYFSHVIADPQNGDTVWVLNLKAWKSIDGGKTFTEVSTPHADNHDLWIDSRNPRRMIEGNDGGACVSLNAGDTWSTIYNQLTAQFYRLDVDNQFPYRVYATQQDNSSISVPSQTSHGAITWSDCYPAGTGESGFIAVHPKDANIVYVGAVGSSTGGGAALQRYDHKSRQIRLVNVWPEESSGIGPKEQKYRFSWTFPILFSPHDSNVIYTAGNIVFRTNNEGESWEPISPDLTRNDATKLEASGGPITKDTTGAEDYATISALVESPHEADVLWAGSDDGRIHLTRDGGISWKDVTPAALPEWAYVHSIEVSPHDAMTVYVAATRYKLEDVQPYLYKSNDYGETWMQINSGIPADDFTRVLRADPVLSGLLFAGTETGVYVSWDDGASWNRVHSNLPVTPIYDMRIKVNDLIAATHGRSFWIMEDLTPLRQYAANPVQTAPTLYKPGDVYRRIPDLTSEWFEGEGKQYHIGLGAPTIYIQHTSDLGQTEREFLDAGENPPAGVVVFYTLAGNPADGLAFSLTFADERSGVVRTFIPKPAASTDQRVDDAPKVAKDKGPWLPAETGLNRFVWDMRHAEATRVPGEKIVKEGHRGPFVVPGVYHVTLTMGEQTFSESFEVRGDPRVSTRPEELEVQLALLLQVRDKLSETHAAVNSIRSLKRQLMEWEHRTKTDTTSEDIAQAARELSEHLSTIEDRLIFPDDAEAYAKKMNYAARLNYKLAALIPVIDSSDAAPTQQAREVFELVAGRIDTQLAHLQQLIDSEVQAFNSRVLTSKLPALLA